MDLLEAEPLLLKDEIIAVSYTENIEGATVKRTLQIRRIAYYSKKHDTTFIYWTNNTTLTATEIVEIYQNRWQIENSLKN